MCSVGIRVGHSVPETMEEAVALRKGPATAGLSSKSSTTSSSRPLRCERAPQQQAYNVVFLVDVGYLVVADYLVAVVFLVCLLYTSDAADE